MIPITGWGEWLPILGNESKGKPDFKGSRLGSVQLGNLRAESFHRVRALGFPAG